ncbi:Ig-like domain-containing protein, partial [Acinetobacter faecalis]|uniref:BapA/Bap/LapF family large adhesin n=1 Tax=Acinetobacter faecalis TaxID=2665161 RepID=UPI002A91F174
EDLAEANKELIAAQEALQDAITAANNALASTDPLLDGEERNSVYEALIKAQQELIESVTAEEFYDAALALNKAVEAAIAAERAEDLAEANKELTAAQKALQEAIEAAEAALKPDATPLLDGAEQTALLAALSTAKDAKGLTDVDALNTAANTLRTAIDEVVAAEQAEIEALRVLEKLIQTAEEQSYPAEIQALLDQAIESANSVAVRLESSKAELEAATKKLTEALSKAASTQEALDSQALKEAQEALQEAITAANNALASTDPLLDGEERDAVWEALSDAKGQLNSDDLQAVITATDTLNDAVRDAIAAERAEDLAEANKELTAAQKALQEAIEAADEALNSVNPKLDGTQEIELLKALALAQGKLNSKDVVELNKAADDLVAATNKAVSEEQAELVALQGLVDLIEEVQLEATSGEFDQAIANTLQQAIINATNIADRPESSKSELEEASRVLAEQLDAAKSAQLDLENQIVEDVRSLLKQAIKDAELALESTAPLLDGYEKEAVLQGLVVAKDSLDSSDIDELKLAADTLNEVVDKAVTQENLELEALQELRESIELAQSKTYDPDIQYVLDKVIVWAEKVADRDSSTEEELRDALIELEDAIAYAESQSTIVSDINAPEISINPLGLKNDKQPLITGTASDESNFEIFVEIKDTSGNVIDSGLAVITGNTWQYKASNELEDSEYTVVATATDVAGNTNKSHIIELIIDATAPQGLKAALVEDTSIVDDKISKNGQVAVTGIENGATWEYSLNNGISWIKGVGESFKLSDGQYNVILRQKDAAGNIEIYDMGKVIIDNQNPIISELSISANNSVVSGKTEAYVSVEITLDDKVVGTVQANELGQFTFVMPEQITNKVIIKFKATDLAGNESPYSIIETQALGEGQLFIPADNNVVLVADITPTIRQPNVAKENILASETTGFTIVNAGLGDVLNASVLGDVLKTSLQIDVAEDTMRRITLKSQAGGVAVLTEYDLYVYRLNKGTGEYEQFKVQPSWLKASLLAGNSDSLTLDLPEGEYIAFLSPKFGITALVGYTLFVMDDQVLDYSNPVAVSGGYSGDVIKDVDTQSGVDIVPAGTTVTQIKFIDNTLPEGSTNTTTPVSVTDSGGTLIQGKFGTLTIKSDGTYSYKLNSDFKGVYGEAKETFEYTLTSGGVSKSAELVIVIDNKVPELSPVKMTDTLVVSPVASVTDVTKTSDKLADFTSFELLQVGLLDPILNANAVKLSDYRQFTVAENTVRELTMVGDAGGVAVGATFTLLIYKKDITGNYVQYHVEENWYSAVLLGGKSKPLTLSFPEGEYIARIGLGGILNVAVGSTLKFTNDYVYDYSQPVENSVQGVSKNSIALDSDEIIYKVNDIAFTPNSPSDEPATIIITGKFGTLTINEKGEYQYQINSNTSTWTELPYGKVESFNYYVKDAQGNVRVENLNFEISLNNAEDLNATVALEMSNVIEPVSQQIFSGLKGEIKETIIIQEGFASESVNLFFNTTYKLTEGRKITYEIQKLGSNEVVKGVIEGAENGQYANEIGIPNLSSGQYSFTAKLEGFPLGASFTSSIIKYQKIDLDNFVLEGAKAKGSLVNYSSFVNAESYTVNGKTVSPLAGSNSISVQGKYGTLVIFKDGSYEYTASGTGYGLEEFDYVVKPIVGASDKGTLTIEVPPSITLNHYSGSDYNDIINGTANNDFIDSNAGDDTINGGAGNDTINGGAGNDTITGGEGIDTVVFDLLSQLSDDGGNGFDVWTDFTVGQDTGDIIDVSKLLNGLQDEDNISEYISIAVKGDDVVLSIDRDGSASNYGKADLLNLQGKAKDSNFLETKDGVLVLKSEDAILKQLLDNNQIVF